MATSATGKRTVDSDAVPALEAELERLHGTPHCCVVRTEARAEGFTAEVAVLRSRHEPPWGRLLTVYLVDSDPSGTVIEQVPDRTLGSKWQRSACRPGRARKQSPARK